MASAKLYNRTLQNRILSFCLSRESCLPCRNDIRKFRAFSTYNNQDMSKSRKSSVVMLGLVGMGMGALVGAGYSYRKLSQSKVAILNEAGTECPVVKAHPDIPLSRQIIISTDHTGLKLTLFQYPTCPFCCKVRAFLDYYGISYNVVEVNPVLRQQIKWSDYKKVPIVLAKVEEGYQQLNDSSMIISALTSYLEDRDQSLRDVVKCYPKMTFNDEFGERKSEILNRYFLMYQGNVPKGKTKEIIVEERKWRKWADDVLVHVLSPNVYRTREEALQAFNWFSKVGEWEKHFSAWERYLVIYVGAYAMWIIGKRLKKRHNLKEDVRTSLYDVCNFWMKTIKNKGKPFMGGNNPDLSDLAVYGVLNSIEGCIAFQDLLRNTTIGTWYNSMKECVQNHEGSVMSV